MLASGPRTPPCRGEVEIQKKRFHTGMPMAAARAVAMSRPAALMINCEGTSEN